MNAAIGLFFANLGLVLFICSLLFILIHRIINKRLLFSEIAYRWISLMPLGLTAIYAFIMHAFFPVFTAATIGWQDSPFQFEVAMANLAIGVIAILSFKASFDFRLATVIASTCWLWGDAVGHIYQMIVHQNFTIGNAGSWFWMDILVPLLLIISLFRLRVQIK
ncbi:Uncharacterised protein (plasmid) [Legionella adelaidensis]|uniref:Transmembrane protein n=1 Tax=Legionella adelaidensis TaxID=45056 RepID=A0A0W0R5A5_9GAMM|nr:DUF6790 family protein [Legionella adelaidensis]KTC66262.1 hypothetical protein Lade_0920 [Legionella adelaidensis]VEH84858.1 Uncharacterised protein [Legionella adelaidensis]